MENNDAQTQQREYYAKTAAEYDRRHLLEAEHEFALAQLTGLLAYYNLRSLLDVGAGTGRVIRHGRHNLPGVRIMGVEPVKELRETAYAHGVPRGQLIEGDALALPFDSDSWDVVCAFGVLHHIAEPERAVLEMCRVARHGVFLSDVNNFGCGSRLQRTFAQSLRFAGLWQLFQWLKNGGKLAKYSEGDGVFYSYSLFDSLDTIRLKFPQTHLTNTRGVANSLYRGCSHISVFAVRSAEQLEELNPHGAASASQENPEV